MYILHDLWDGIVPREKAFFDDAEYHAAAHRSTDADIRLRETLQPAQQELFDALEKEESTLLNLARRDLFSYAFCMGARLMLDILGETL